MLNYEKLTALAAECGFTYSAPLDVAKFEFLQEVRDMCAADKCHKYNKSWACPPACGSLEEIREKVAGYSEGILVQTVGDIEDSWDWDGIMDAAKTHSGNFMSMWNKLGKEYAHIFAMGTGGCPICETCSYPDNPCRFPDKKSISMEAYGLFVSKVCADNNLAYNYGADKIAYTACFLLKD